MHSTNMKYVDCMQPVNNPEGLEFTSIPEVPLAKPTECSSMTGTGLVLQEDMGLIGHLNAGFRRVSNFYYGYGY